MFDSLALVRKNIDNSVVIYPCTGDLQKYANEVYIQKEEDKIDENAFRNCKHLTYVYFPPTIASIGSNAFNCCESVIDIDLSTTKLKVIDVNTFSGCSSLVSVTFPCTLTSIGQNAFNECSSLDSIVIPCTVTSIGPKAFYGCSSLRSIYLPSAIGSIAPGTFQGCSSLSSIRLPSTILWIAPEAFLGCSSLVFFSFPSTLTSINEGSFSGCSSLAFILLPSTIQSIGQRAFEGCSSLASIILPSTVTYIGEKAFDGCSKVEFVSFLPKNLTIKSEAFYNCQSLSSVTISTVTEIKGNSFDGRKTQINRSDNWYRIGQLIKLRELIEKKRAAPLKHARLGCDLQLIQDFIVNECDDIFRTVLEFAKDEPKVDENASSVMARNDTTYWREIQRQHRRDVGRSYYTRDDRWHDIATS